MICPGLDRQLFGIIFAQIMAMSNSGNPEKGVELQRFVYAGNATQSASFGSGRGPIFMEYVHCSGFEESLLDCDHSGLGLSTCRHWEDAGVVCQGEISSCLVETCQG